MAETLHKLSKALPIIDKKGWEIEFATNQSGIYVLQTTPISNIKRPMPMGKAGYDQTGNIFHCVSAVGFDEVETHGILYLPSLGIRGLDEAKLYDIITAFDEKNPGYFLATVHANLMGDSTLLSITRNSGVIADIARGMYAGRGFAPHVATAIRQKKSAMAGFFTENSLNEYLREDMTGFGTNDLPLSYSPTRMRTIVDETAKVGIVKLIDGEVKPFTPIS